VSWNYRVIRVDYVDPDTKAIEPCYSVHRCFYNKEEDVIPVKWGQQPASAEGASIEELKLDWARQLEAINKPVLVEKRGKLVESKNG